ncbi:MAG: START-like domain-containing protein [Bacteroidota bacterium]
MSEKRKIELEYLLKTSVKVFENMIFTPNGLAEWFADDVNVKEDIYNFHWDGSDEKARLLGKKLGSFIKWQWLADEEKGLDTYFQMECSVDQMTKALVLNITDFADEEDYDEIKMLWESSVNELKRVLGA